MDSKETLFLQTIGQNKGMLFKICRIYQYDPQDRDDLLQEIVLQLWTVFDLYRGESKITSWMYRVALNTAITFFKKQKRRVCLPGACRCSALQRNNVVISFLRLQGEFSSLVCHAF